MLKAKWRSGVIGLAVIIAILVQYRDIARVFITHQWSLLRLYEETSYNRAVLTSNYFDSGFVHRGLAGTIDLILSNDSMIGGLLFELMSIVLLLIPLSIILVRLSRKLKTLAFLYMTTVVVLSPQTFLGWSEDLVRTDLFVVAAIAWAVLATLVNRRGLAILILLVGFLVHETALIFGLPLLFALNLQAYRRDELSLGKGATLILIIVAGVAAIYLAQYALSAPVPVVTARMLQRFPSRESPVSLDMRDAATYFAVAGGRGLKTAICFNQRVSQQFFFMAALSIVVSAIYVLILRLQRKPLATVICVFLPLLFMFALANDTGRWLKLAVMNAWLFAAALQDMDPEAASPSPVNQALGVVCLVVLLAMGSTRVQEVNRFSLKLALKLGMAMPGDPKVWLNKCDPTWRTVLAPTPPARAR